MFFKRKKEQKEYLIDFVVEDLVLPITQEEAEYVILNGSLTIKEEPDVSAYSLSTDVNSVVKKYPIDIELFEYLKDISVYRAGKKYVWDRKKIFSK